jgi:hypothetical protein
MTICITVVATCSITLVIAQASAREMDMAVTRYENNIKEELIDTSIESQDDKLKEMCNWCGYLNHHEKDCQEKRESLLHLAMVIEKR